MANTMTRSVTRNGKVYISHTALDDAQIAPLLAALKSKHVDVCYEPDPAEDALGMEPTLHDEIADRDVFIRIVSQHTAASPRMALELKEFEQAQTQDAERGESQRRARINLIVDPTYERQPTDVGAMTINITNKPETAWLPAIFAELGQLKPTLRYSYAPLFYAVLFIILSFAAVVGFLYFLTMMFHGGVSSAPPAGGPLP